MTDFVASPEHDLDPFILSPAGGRGRGEGYTVLE